jgi:hypothetical protein
MTANDNDPNFADDVLRGAAEIATFMRTTRRHIYHLVATSKSFPYFRDGGSTVCARKSVLLAYVKRQEERHANDNRIQACEKKRSA